MEPKNSAESSGDEEESLPPVMRTPSSGSSWSVSPEDREVREEVADSDVTKDRVGGDHEAVTGGQPAVVLDRGVDPVEVLGHLHVNLILPLLYKRESGGSPVSGDLSTGGGVPRLPVADDPHQGVDTSLLHRQGTAAVSLRLAIKSWDRRQDKPCRTLLSSHRHTTWTP